MDPQATINLIHECADEEDYLSLEDSCDDLIAWFNRGGFAPRDAIVQLRFIYTTIPAEQISARNHVQACINAIP